MAVPEAQIRYPLRVRLLLKPSREAAMRPVQAYAAPRAGEVRYRFVIDLATL